MILEDKSAIVTGASRGLGASISALLTQNKCQVYGIARSKDRLKEMQQKLGDLFIPVTLDITSHQEISDWFKETFSDSNPPDILINNAGAGYFAEVDKLSLEKWHQMVETNLNGVFYLSREVVPLMKSNSNSSHIISIGSILGKTANAKQSAYSATKFAIQGFSEALFKELRYDGIKVSCVNPGSIETNFFRESGIEPHANMMSPKDVARMVLHILETPDNMLISDITMRPLDPKRG